MVASRNAPEIMFLDSELRIMAAQISPASTLEDFDLFRCADIDSRSGIEIKPAPAANRLPGQRTDIKHGLGKQVQGRLVQNQGQVGRPVGAEIYETGAVHHGGGEDRAGADLEAAGEPRELR